MINYKRRVFMSICTAALAVCMCFTALSWVFEQMLPASAASNATVSGYEAQIKELENKEAELKRKLNLSSPTARSQ